MEAGQLDAFAQLARALGILDQSGDTNTAWFSNPVGGSSNLHGLRNVLGDDHQREALLEFVDGVLGPPDRLQKAGAVWVPLFRETSPQITIYAVVKAVDDGVHLGVGIEHATTGAAPTVATRVHVPLFQLERDGHTSPPGGGPLPNWLLLGRAGGRIEVSVDATIRDTPPAAGVASLGGLALTLGIPTATDDDLSIHLDLTDLQLPGATAPQTFSLDAASLDELGPDVFSLLVGLVRAQADAIDVGNATLRPFAALTGLLGLRSVAGLPALPLAELPTRGVAAIVEWMEGLLANNAARDAWLGQLALLLGATPDLARDAVTFTVGIATVAVGLRVGPGTTGHPVLTPWAEVALAARTGAQVRLAADLLRADTGTGAVTAFPDLRAEAVFGADAGGGALLTGNPAVGSLHVGIGLLANRQPTFVLTLSDVDLAGRHHDVLDLSSPQAALDSANEVIDGALASALEALGLAGGLVNKLIGLAPPVGVTALDATGLVTDPIGAVSRYWRDLTATPAAMADVLGALRRLIRGGAVALAPGSGTPAIPWRVDFVDGIGLSVFRDPADDALVVQVGATLATPVLGEFTASARLALTLLRATFTPARATFGSDVRASLSLRRTDGTTQRLPIGPVALVATSLGATATWSPARGFLVVMDEEDLGLEITRSHHGVVGIDLPLPTLDGAGNLSLTAPVWTDVEAGLAALLSTVRVPVIDAALELVGWAGNGPRLSLDGLFGADPGAAVAAWLADLILDCERLRASLGPVAAVLSGFARSRPFGVGSERVPFRCTVAGEARAPGLAAWLLPGCPPRNDDLLRPLVELQSEIPPEPRALVTALETAGRALPDVADLLVGRDSLADGFSQLTERWVGTDGLVGAPTALPDGVSTLVMTGVSYGELVAQGLTQMLLGDVLDVVPTAVVHVGCESSFATEHPDTTVFDLTTTGTTGALPASGAGTWLVRLPNPVEAERARPERGAIGEQAARLAAALATRTAPIAIVAYGGCGAAAIRVAATLPQVSHVVTVGTPWSGLATEALRSGLSGDALVLLGRLLRDDVPAWSDPLFAREATPLQTMRELVARSLIAGVEPALLPSAHTEPRRAGLIVKAVFGALQAEELAFGLGALIADTITSRFEATESAVAPLPHTSLHVGVNLPVFDLDLGGLLVGVGATVELGALERTDGGLRVASARGLVLDLHLGVHDGWLVGGPGAASRDIETRWMSAQIRVPFDDRPGDTEFVLHEAKAFAAYRESWVVRADAVDATATLLLPEVRIILSSVVARLQSASSALGTLLSRCGLVRDGGLDPEAVARLLHDPVATVAAARASGAAEIAAALRTLIPTSTGTGGDVSWHAGSATLAVDLAARSVSATLSTHEAGLPALDVSVSLSSAGPSFSLALGTGEAGAGGLRLVGRAGVAVADGAGAADLGLEWSVPGGAPRRMALLPTPDVTQLQSLLTVLLPSALARGLADYLRANLRGAHRLAFDGALDVLELLGPADERGQRAVRLPLGLFDDPGAWLRHGVATWTASPATSVVSLLDAVKPLVHAGPASEAGWRLADGIFVRYGAGPDTGQVDIALDVTLDVALDGHAIGTRLLGGVRIGPTGSPQPLFEAAVTVDDCGLRIALAPHLRIALERPAPAAPLELYPSGPGLGSALAAAGEMVIPPVLNAVIARRADAGASLVKDVGSATFSLADALDLLDAEHVTSARVTAFAADPGGRLLGRLPALVASGTAALAHALDPAGTLVRVTGPTAGRVTLEFGSARSTRLTLDASGPTPVVELGARATLPGIGVIELEALRLSAAGVQVAARLGPAVISAGPFHLYPLVVVRAGISSAGFSRMLGLGLALDAEATSAVQFRWALDESPPSLLVTHAGGAEETSPEAIAIQLLSQACALAMGVLVDALGPTLTTTAKQLLRGVVFHDAADSTALAPALFTDLFQHPENLFNRFQRLLWNATTLTTPFALTIDSTVTLAIVGQGPDAGPKRLGVSVSLVPGKRFQLAPGDPRVELEVDASWVHPTVPAGLAVFLVQGTRSGDSYAFTFSPSVSVAGLGLRFSKTSGPVLSLGDLSLDAIAVQIYGEAGPTGVGGGVRLELAGLAVSPGGTGGNNAAANSILNDAGASGAANRPAFSPSLAVQIHPGESGPSVSLRAGDPPGPWWVLVQRQLGPLYMERMGFNSVEQNGQLTRVELYFDGRVSLFGLTASVDQLSLSWLGGDFFDITRWAVDLQGLAVAADMSGVSLSGGLLKTTEGTSVSYVGMLFARFGIYGLSIFGGYTDDHGTPSFFVFGALNGPIGGPPAFFVTGIGGGFGLNRGLRVPDDVGHMNEYPFVKALDPAASAPADPMAELRRLGTYFPPVRGNFWFAAGISFTCFSLVDGIAVLSVSFGDGLEINLMGLARMALPRPQAALVSIELGLLARFSTSEGLFSIRAQLTENSWLLYEDVRLTGGFAFVVWWKGPNKGQFVLSLGGYHPDFHRDGYPDVPRLGLIWQVTEQIVIKGGAYFALTSEALMAGVGIEVSADFGFAWARIAFGADGIVYFDPFWFEVSAYARISAGVKIETFFGTISFGISLGAEVRVWGPEFSGEATLEIGPCSITVGFGSERAVPKRVLTWPEFVAKYLEDDGGRARALSAITGRGTLPSATKGDTSAPPADGSTARPFEVFAEFELTITTSIPTQHFALTGSASVNAAVTRSDGAAASLGLSPMRASALSSTVTLDLVKVNGTSTDPFNHKLALLGANLTATTPKPDGSSLGTDAFPIGTWGAPQPEGLAAQPLPKGDVLFAGNAIRLVAEAADFDRGPEIDYYTVIAARRPLPLSAGGPSRAQLLTRADTVKDAFGPITSAEDALKAARNTLFRSQSAPPTGVLTNATQSHLARAAFIGERTAPPLFGTLADGLRAANAADGTAARQAPPAAVAYPGTRAPAVVAVLSAGAQVAPRAPRTTVANGKIKRRPAPTMDSVQARLSPHLPIKMVVASAPATVAGGTVIPTGVVPRTEVPGIARTYARGTSAGLRGLDSFVGGLGATPGAAVPKAAQATSRLNRGDLVILNVPDAAVDVGTRARPSLHLDAPARVTLLEGSGRVLLDSVTQGPVTVPERTALMAVQAGAAGALEGLAGWYAPMKVACLGSHVALAAGCVLHIEEADSGRQPGWALASEATARAAAIVTRFTLPARTLVVVLQDADPEHLAAIRLELTGALRVRQPDGTPQPPTVVLAGAEAALIYAITPLPQEAVSVRVASGGTWRLVGVMGGDDTVAHVAELIRQRGVLRVTARLLAQTGASCGLTWVPAAAPRPNPNQPKRPARASAPTTPKTKTKRGKQHGGR